MCFLVYLTLNETDFRDIIYLYSQIKRIFICKYIIKGWGVIMNKVLVTGLGVGNDFGVCQSCNLDFTWILKNPSTLVWADKIIVTKNAWNANRIELKDERCNKGEKALDLVLEIMNDYDLIEIVEPKIMFKKEMNEIIYSQVEKDIKSMLTKFNKAIKKGDEGVPDEIIIEDMGYCGPYIASLYSSIELAEACGANCLFNKRDYTFLKYKYGIFNESVIKGDKLDTMNEIFTLYLPYQNLLPEYAKTSDEHCNSCKKISSCKDSYLKDLELNTKKLLEWRNYDEIARAKEELKKIIDNKYYLGEQVIPEEIKMEFEKEQYKINKNIKKIFPAIKRWTNITTVVATPLSILSAVTGNMPATVASSGLLGISKATEEYMKYYENKNNWVGFINNNR